MARTLVAVDELDRHGDVLMAARTLKLGRNLRLPVEAVTESFALLAMRGAGKRLCVETPIPTPTGWTTMGELSPGDLVIGGDGRPASVTWVSDVEWAPDSLAVRFSDGEVLYADAEHQWVTETAHERRYRKQRVEDPNPSWASRPQCTPSVSAGPSIRTTAEIRATLLYSGRERNHAVRNAQPLVLDQRLDLPIDPYVLGVWLGDGTSATGSITSADQQIIDEIRGRGFEVSEIPSTRKERHSSYRVAGLTTLLRSAGLLNNKHVPVSYLRASSTQRLELLQGLMDTDGGWSNRSAEIAMTNEDLVDAVYELVVSLGMRATRSSRPAKLNGVQHGTSYRISFTPIVPVFRLERKAQRLDFTCAQQERRTRRYITAVDPIPAVRMRCISVDSPDNTYLAGRGMIPTHNSNAAVRMAEEMYAAGLPWVAVDPKGDWFGLRSSVDGTGPGLPIPVFGGLHGDLPLEPTSGPLIADLIVDHNLTCILDVSDFDSKAGQMRFLTEFGERMFRRHGREPQARHFFLEEADDYLPQQVMKDTARCVGMWTKIVKQGRSRGLGVTLVSQRAAVVNKNALTQTGTLIAMRATSPQDRRAIRDWVDHHAAAPEIVDSLPSLKSGEAWVCSPHWLGETKKVRFDRRATFDSGATPAPGTVRRPATLADINLGELRDQLGEVVERAEADDPKVLHRRIRDLEAQLAKARKAAPAPERVVETVVETVEVVPDSARAALDQAVRVLEDVGSDLSVLTGRMVEAHKTLLGEVAGLDDEPTTPPARQRTASSAPAVRTQRAARGHAGTASTRPATPAQTATVADDAAVHLKAGARRILESMARHHPTVLTRAQIGTLSKMKITGGTFATYWSTLKRAGLIDENDTGAWITDSGLATAGVEPADPHTTDELLDMWRGALKAGARRILDVLVDAYPEPVTRTDLAAAVEMAETGGTFATYLSTLRRNGLADVTASDARASDTLFL